MRKATFYFIIVEALDVLTTAIGLNIGLELYEVNPIVSHIGWPAMICLKIVITTVTAIILELKEERKIDMIFPCLFAIPPLWNITMIVIAIGGI